LKCFCCGKPQYRGTNSLASARKEDDAMDKTVTPSDKIANLLNARLRKERLQSEPTEKVISNSVMARKMLEELAAVVRQYVEAVRNLTVRRVTEINRNQSPEQMLKATKRKIYSETGVVSTMPRGKGQDKEVTIFKPGKRLNDIQLPYEYDLLGLVPVDPYTLAKLVQDNTAFADRRLLVTVWRDSDEEWCFIAFYRWIDGTRLRYISRR